MNKNEQAREAQQNNNFILDKLVEEIHSKEKHIESLTGELLIKLALRLEDGLDTEEELLNKDELIEIMEEIKETDNQKDALTGFLSKLGYEKDNMAWRNKLYELTEAKKE